MASLTLRSTAVLLALMIVPVIRLDQARRDFKRTDFAKLRWIEGTWQGSGGGYAAFYERYRFINDSTIEMNAFTDSTLATVDRRSTIALRAGRIIDESADSRYEAAKVTGAAIQFVPVRGATNSFQFTRMSRDRWTATIHTGQNRKKVVYEMRRAARGN